MAKAKEDKIYTTFKDFYPFYLGQHSNRTNRRLHIIGTTLVVLILAFAILSGKLRLLAYLPLVGYGFAWIGHFIFEKNKPATFKYPIYSFMGDFKMWFETLTCNRRF